MDNLCFRALWKLTSAPINLVLSILVIYFYFTGEICHAGGSTSMMITILALLLSEVFTKHVNSCGHHPHVLRDLCCFVHNTLTLIVLSGCSIWGENLERWVCASLPKSITFCYTSPSQSYLATNSLRPSSRLSPCSSSRETLRLRGLTGSGVSSVRAAENSSTNVPRNRRASSSSILLTLTGANCLVNGRSGLTEGPASQITKGHLKGKKWHKWISIITLCFFYLLFTMQVFK